MLLEQPREDQSSTNLAETKTRVSLARGDGIGPEIMDAVLHVLREAGAELELEPVELGEQVYRRGITSGMTEAAWESIRRTGVLLKAPITTPRGGGYKSLNVTLRKTLGLFANVRPCRALSPRGRAKHPDLDVVIVRENEEDTYGGIEHRQTDEVTQCLKLITRPGCERIARYAFEFARVHGRRKITCLTKDNIMKITDGLFRKVFEEVAREYSDIETESLIVDIGTARLADRPELFDVVLCPNLYGDIVSDITAELSGSVGLCGSANVGEQSAMFEAIHGSAPDIAGRGVANPSGLLSAAVMMLDHIGQGEVAARIENAWLSTLESGIHTPDMAPGRAEQSVGTVDFTREIVRRLGQTPEKLPQRDATSGRVPTRGLVRPRPRAEKRLHGIDIFLDLVSEPDPLGARLTAASTEALRLTMITNRGVKVWPAGHPETLCTDHWRCRFEPVGEDAEVTPMQLLELQRSLVEAGLPPIKTENLYSFDGERGYSLGQGQ